MSVLTGLLNLAEELSGLSVKQLVDKGYPEEVAQKIASGELPMDEASRLARAQEQGYGDVLWRGHSLEDMPTSNSDIWATPDQSVAETYAGLRAIQSPTFQAGLSPLRTNANNLAEVNGRGAQWKSVQTNPRKLPGLQVDDPNINRPLKGTDDIAEAVKGSGNYQGTVFRNTKDDAVKTRGNEATDTYNILGSRPDVNIRHAENAAFDPEYNGSSIMGGLLAGGVGLGALSQSEDADAGGATSLVQLILKKFGNDVDGATQELVRMGGFPEPVARRIATGELPMDEASRVARREAQTRPETYYNGGNTGGLLEVDPEMSGSARGMSAETGFWGAGSPHRANGYAGNPLSDNSTVYPFRVMDNSDHFIVDGQGAAWNNIKPSSPVSVKHWNEGEESYGTIASWTDDYYDTNSIAHMAKDKGDFNSVSFRGIADAADEGNVHVELAEMFPELEKMPYGSKARRDFMDGLSPEDKTEAYRRAEVKSNGTGESIAVFDPDDIRSPNAAFDPQYTGSNIMGNATVPLLGATAAGSAGLLAVPILMGDKGQPTTPEERGFKSWEEVSRDPTAPLPAPTWGEAMGKAGSNLMHVLGLPMTGLQGIARGGYGLLTGEDFTEAAAQAGNTMDVGWRDGLLDVSGMNPDKGADQAAGYVTDKTGDESLGWMVKMGLLFGGI